MKRIRKFYSWGRICILYKQVILQRCLNLRYLNDMWITGWKVFSTKETTASISSNGESKGHLKKIFQQAIVTHTNLMEARRSFHFNARFPIHTVWLYWTIALCNFSWVSIRFFMAFPKLIEQLCVSLITSNNNEIIFTLKTSTASLKEIK